MEDGTQAAALCPSCGQPGEKNRLCECGAGWLTPSVKTVVILLCLPIELFGRVMRTLDAESAESISRAVFDVAGFFPPWTDALRRSVLQEFLEDSRPGLSQAIETVVARFEGRPRESLDRLVSLWGPIQLHRTTRRALQLHRLHSPYWTRIQGAGGH
ncbi:MAG: hypothetical protein HY319_10110 [Armatimonadetes bacterium]|nr:hypothetical protein [Armatimonadota bacterium]